MFERIAGEQELATLPEQVLEHQVDRADGAVEVQRSEEVGADPHEADERLHPSIQNRQASIRKERVADQPVEIERPRAEARHVGIAQDEVHVVDRVDPAQQAAQVPQPARYRILLVAPRADDEPGDLSRIERLVGRQFPLRRATDPPDRVAESVADDHRAEGLVSQAPAGQEVGVEEVAEGTMSDIVQQSGEPQQRFDVRSARTVRVMFGERRVELLRQSTTQMHRPDDMLETGVLGRREDPPGGLQLVDLTHPLHPRIVDQLPLAPFFGPQVDVRDERDVAVDRVVAEILATVGEHP
jgi:hypothetical protein